MAKAVSTDGTPQWQYLRIRPSDQSLTARAITSAFEKIHRVDASIKLEWLLVTNGDHVEYYLGTADEYHRTVEHIVRSLVSEKTTVESTTHTPPTIEEETPAAAVEFRGRGERRDDWQTRLTPVCRDEKPPLFPLASLVDVLASPWGDTHLGSR